MFERMLVGGIENRITLGLLSFVLTMVFLGWAAINEGGRMQAFQQMEEARAIEQGAMLFAANCTTCHGLDGRGGGRAPGLNNPQFFGHDFFPEITKQVTDLTAERTNLTAEKGTLTTEQNAEGTTEARKTEIAARLTEIDTRVGEINTQIDNLNADRSNQVQAAVDKGYIPAEFSRTTQVGWTGTHESFVLTTLIHGRPVSGSYFTTGAMPAWSQLAGGPLRMDQLEDLVAYIENWDKGEAWTLEDLFAVGKFALKPIDPALAGPPVDTIGADPTAALAEIAQLTGDAARGDQLFHGATRTGARVGLICNTCHLADANGVGPLANGLYNRVVNERLNEARFAGYTPEQYLVESILQPNTYVVNGFTSGVMPATLGDSLTAQDLADLVAYLATLNQ